MIIKDQKELKFDEMKEFITNCINNFHPSTFFLFDNLQFPTNIFSVIFANYGTVKVIFSLGLTHVVPSFMFVHFSYAYSL